MAAFKLQEAARRLRGLAREATGPEARERFRALANELGEREAQLWALLEGESAGGTPPAPDAAASAAGRRRERPD